MQCSNWQKASFGCLLGRRQETKYFEGLQNIINNVISIQMNRNNRNRTEIEISCIADKLILTLFSSWSPFLLLDILMFSSHMVCRLEKNLSQTIPSALKKNISSSPPLLCRDLLYLSLNACCCNLRRVRTGASASVGGRLLAAGLKNEQMKASRHPPAGSTQKNEINKLSLKVGVSKPREILVFTCAKRNHMLQKRSLFV